MTRILLNYLLPLALPTAIYLGWMFYLRHRSKARGDEVPEIKSASVFVSVLVGIILMFAGLAYLAVNSGAPPGEGSYEAPSLKDGKITEPKFN